MSCRDAPALEAIKQIASTSMAEDNPAKLTVRASLWPKLLADVDP
jgi:hypothetical protein